MDDTHQQERWRLEAQLHRANAELDELRWIVASLANIFTMRQAGQHREAAALLDDLQRNWTAAMRDRYPTGRP